MKSGTDDVDSEKKWENCSLNSTKKHLHDSCPSLPTLEKLLHSQQKWMKVIVRILLVVILILAVTTTVLMLQMMQTRGCLHQLQHESSMRSSIRSSMRSSMRGDATHADASDAGGGSRRVKRAIGDSFLTGKAFAMLLLHFT